MGLAKKFLTISGLTVVSRVFGVVREALMLHFLGASVEMDAFTTAFKFPSFFRKFFAEGGFQSIFVPYYTDYISYSKHKSAKYFSSRIFMLIFWIMLALSIVVHIFAKEFTLLMAPGFVKCPEKLALTIEFTRIIFPSIAFISLSTVYSGILLSRQKFFLYALAPILTNIILVCSLFTFQDFTSAGRRLSYGTLLAGICQFLYMFFCVKYQKLPSPRFSLVKLSPRIKTFLRKMVPVLAGAGVAQVNILVGMLFASFLQTGCITYLYCADRFIQLPLALFGISMGTLLLPEIADKVATSHTDAIKDVTHKSILFAMRMTLPSVAILAITGIYMVSLLYGHGKFDQSAVESTANILTITAFGLPAFVISKIMSSILIAQKDTKTPFVAAITSIIANALFSTILIKGFGVSGIAASATIAGYVNMIVICYKSTGWFRMDKHETKDIAKIFCSSVALFVSMLILKAQLGAVYSKLGELFLLSGLILAGAIVYILCLYFSKDAAILNAIAYIRKRASK